MRRLCGGGPPGPGPCPGAAGPGLPGYGVPGRCHPIPADGPHRLLRALRLGIPVSCPGRGRGPGQPDVPSQTALKKRRLSNKQKAPWDSFPRELFLCANCVRAGPVPLGRRPKLPGAPGPCCSNGSCPAVRQSARWAGIWPTAGIVPAGSGFFRH